MSYGADLDYATLLNWIDKGDRELQKTALEQLCMTILISDNVDRCFENCPPREFLPALCRIFLDETATVSVLETAARAMTYYMDMSSECSKRITSVDGTIKSICDRITLMADDASANRELVEQCVKVLEHICQREANLVYEAGGFLRLLQLVRDYIHVIHNDTLRSAMSVITRLCTKLDTSEAIQSDYSVTLAELLTHADLKVSESALRSIAAIVDRFIRSGTDPFEFVQDSGLIELLLGLIIEKSQNNDDYVLSGKPITFISIVLSLLSNLCRGSASTTDIVVRSDKLIPVLKAVMISKDERCIMDGLRLTDMLLNLMSEGRKVFTRNTSSNTSLEAMPIPANSAQKYKQLIEYIRNRDFTSLKTAFEKSSYDVDYNDDIGQSLLNWIAAYGSVEMAEYLIKKGANVDGGNRSSSLHYAAIFGRPEIAKLLIEHGANPELRDEEGKTPLEKARERHEEGHKQVARLLENPLKKQNSANDVTSVDDVVFQSIFTSLIPILCSVNKTTYLSEVKRSSISIIRKCIAYLPIEKLRKEILKENSNNEFSEKLLSLLENTLDREEDLEIKEQFLLIMKNLLERDLEFWIQHISRLGVYIKVEKLASENITYYMDYPLDNVPEPEDRVIDHSEFNIPPCSLNIDATSAVNLPLSVNKNDNEKIEVLTTGIKNLKWNKWRILFVDGITYIWCDMIAIKLESNDNVIYCTSDFIGSHLLFGTKYVDNNSETKILFREQFLSAKESAVEDEIEECFNNNIDNYKFMNWKLSKIGDDYIKIAHENYTIARIEIRNVFPGFTYYPEEGEMYTVCAKNPLSGIFATGFTKCKTSDREFTQRLKVKELSTNLWDNYLKDCKNKMRKELSLLKDNADLILKILDEEMNVKNERILYNLLEQVKNALISDNNLSIFEIAHSGIVDSFCYVLATCIEQPNGTVASVFKRVFCDEHIINIIIRKLVLVLESLESFPVILYNKTNSAISGMKLLNQKYVLELEQADPKNWLQQKLINQTGKKMRAEPLCSGTHLKLYLLQKLSKFWYDAERKHLKYSRIILEAKEEEEELVFEYNHDFDANGILFFIGTNGYSECKYENPASAGLIKVMSSDGKHVPYDPVDEIFSRSPKSMNIHTRDINGSFFIFDIGVYVYPTAYTLRHSRGYNNSAIRNWTFEGSADNKAWYVISRHKNDKSLNNECSSASWIVNANVEIAFRYFRIVQQGFNANGKTHFLSLAGFELYGSIVDVVNEQLPSLEIKQLYMPNNNLPTKNNSKWSQNIQPAVRHHHVDFDNDDESRRVALRSLFTVQSLIERERGNDDTSSSRNKYKLKSHSVKKSEFDGLSMGALDNSLPPVALKNSSAQSRGKYTYPITQVPVQQPTIKTVKTINRPKIDFKIEQSYPKAKCGYIIKNMKPDASNDKLYGQIVKLDEENGIVHVLWESGTCEKVNYGKNKYDVAILANQISPDERASNVSGPSNVETASTSNTGSTITQKSMSTTNLFERNKPHISMAAKNQAASAESLQHQTPSLENLLLRARLFHDRIPEAGDEQSTSNTPEPTQTDQSLSPSVAASTFGGGSHPVLSQIRRSVDSESSNTRTQTYENIPESRRSETEEDENVEFSGHTESDESIPVYNQIFAAYDDFENSQNVDEFMVEQLGHVLNEEINDNNIRDNSRNEDSSRSLYPTYVDALRSVIDQVINIDRNEEIEEEISFNDDYEEDVTDGTEEDFDEMINQGIQQAVDEPPNVFGDRYAYRAIPNPPTIHALMGEVGEGSLMRENNRYRHLSSFPRRFYEMMVPSHRNSRGDPDRENTGPRASKKPTRLWEENFTLKPTYSALIPVFDPRPGRTNVNQTQEIKIPTGVSDEQLFKKDIGFKTLVNSENFELKPKDLRLYLRGPNVPGVNNVTVEIINDDHKLLFYIQRILSLSDWYRMPYHNSSLNYWEPTFTLIYEVIGNTESTVNISTLDPEKLYNGEVLNISIQRTLDTIAFIKEFIEMCGIRISYDAIISHKLTQKVEQEMNDPLLVSANSLPEWCWFMLTKNKHLFSLNTRWNYLLATSFDTPRSIIWAQGVLDAANEQNISSNNSRRDDNGDYRVGRLLHERVRVPRDDKLFETAIQVLKFHSVKKSVLEIQYFNEEGTGLGPTLEFFALVAAEFQRKDHGMWVCDDNDIQTKGKPEFEYDERPPGYYVRRPGGLFPAPIPPGTEESEKVCQLFKVFGIFLGKIIQDKRIVDMPLSLPLLRLLCISPQNYPSNELGIDDFELVYPDKGKFVKELKHFIEKRDKICVDMLLTREERLHKIKNLKLEFGSNKCTLEEIGLTFVVDPPSNIFYWRNYELIEDGANIEVTVNNADIFFEKILDFHLNTGIKSQLDAMREGFSLVCPLNALSLVTPNELLTILCGDQCPQWTLEELLKYTVPKNGYTEESKTFKNFCEVLAEMNTMERKSFLQFATGCSSLPPGGLANLHPPLTIVRKGDSGDGAYPSVNTCVHYCKVPDYSSKEILKERLSYAVCQKCFFLN